MLRRFGRVLAPALLVVVPGIVAPGPPTGRSSVQRRQVEERPPGDHLGDHSAPTVSVAVTYNVGSADEKARRTGFAHLFEHMMFKGSENVGPGEHPALIFSNGGSMNGTTNADRTLYFEVLPSNQLELALFLEGDRMRSLDINKGNLDNQRGAVQEERRLRVDNQPYGATFERTGEQAYDNPAYKHSTIGSMEDLNAASVDDVATFFRTYYAPNNAVLSIVGDVETKKTMRLIEKYFGVIARQPDPKRPDLTEPPHTAERRSTIDDPLARLARIDIAYIVPPAGSPDSSALDVLSDVLSSGRSARFNQVLVREKQLATNAFAFAQDARGPWLFQVSATVAPGKTPADVEAALYGEIDRVKSAPIADWEIEKAHNGARRNQASAATSTLQRPSSSAMPAFLRRPEPDQHAHRQDPEGDGRPTCNASRANASRRRTDR
jgi:predicted Zn-dependent peptidase